MPSSPVLVSREDLQSLFAELSQQPGDPGAGFFGPDSARWRIDREAALFLGAGRAALLQLAHPWVAASLVHHSNLMNDAIGRFHGTFRVIYTMLFGTRAQAMAASQGLYRLHMAISGELPEAVGAHPAHEHYEANEVSALVWVHATLVQTAVMAYEFAMGPLPGPVREAYYAEGKRLAALFGISATALPADWNAFIAYCSSMLDSPELDVDDTARALGSSVLSGVGTWVRPPFWYRALTASWLPPRLRAGFGLPFGAQEQRALERARRWVPRLYRLTPRAIRYVGPYHEARARLRKRRVGWFTEQNNRFWMGQPRLLFGEKADI